MWRAAIFDLTSKAVVSKQVASLVFFFLDHLEMLWLMKSYHLSKKAAVPFVEDGEVGIFHKHFRGHLAEYVRHVLSVLCSRIVFLTKVFEDGFILTCYLHKSFPIFLCI